MLLSVLLYQIVRELASLFQPVVQVKALCDQHVGSTGLISSPDNRMISNIIKLAYLLGFEPKSCSFGGCCVAHYTRDIEFTHKD